MDIYQSIMVVAQLLIVILVARRTVTTKRDIDSRANSPAWIKGALLGIIGACAVFIGWRLSTIFLINDPQTRIALGNGVLTAMLAGYYVLIAAIGWLSAHDSK